MKKVSVCHIVVHYLKIHLRILLCNYIFLLLFLMFQRSSVSPAEREKYRSRSPDVDPDLKRRKEDKLGGHVSSLPHWRLFTARYSKTQMIVGAVCNILFCHEGMLLGPLRYYVISQFKIVASCIFKILFPDKD